MDQSKELYRLIDKICPKCKKGKLLQSIYNPDKLKCSWTFGCDYSSEKKVKQLTLWESI